MNCRHCGSENLVKDGIVKSKQRYKCKDCARTMRENDERIVYDDAKKLKCLKLYLENVGIRSIERLEGVPNPLIIKWIRRYAELICEIQKRAQKPEKAENIEILEMDELYSFVKKKRDRIYVWTAADRNGGRIAAFEVTRYLSLPSYCKIAGKIRGAYKVRCLCADGNYAYNVIKLADRHIVGKSETCFVESWNAKIRRKLARFNRRTCRYSKAIDMAVASLTLLFNENPLLSIFS